MSAEVAKQLETDQYSLLWCEEGNRRDVMME